MKVNDGRMRWVGSMEMSYMAWLVVTGHSTFLQFFYEPNSYKIEPPQHRCTDGTPHRFGKTCTFKRFAALVRIEQGNASAGECPPQMLTFLTFSSSTSSSSWYSFPSFFFSSCRGSLLRSPVGDCECQILWLIDLSRLEDEARVSGHHALCFEPTFEWDIHYAHGAEANLGSKY